MPVKPIPEGYPRVIPYLAVEGAEGFIAFMRQVFEAELTLQLMQPDGKIGHTELRIGNSVIMLSEAGERNPAMPVVLYLYVEDVDAVFKSAIAAGASVILEPADQFYGDRAGACREPSGFPIWIASNIEDVSPEELKRRAAAH